MKLHVSILSKLIELPTQDMNELRHVLDDLGLEVKGVEGAGLKTIFNIETLANRGDHLSALGVARELSARYLAAVSAPTVASSFQDRKGSIPVRKATDLCSRYALLELQLPPGMKLRPDVASVMSPGAPSEKPAIVDLLNYLQVEIGQPMHAFDRDKIDGEIIIELSQKPETIEALDGKTYTVPAQSIVIKDRKKVVAVAGVIGCANSMVTASTTRALIESAAFDPVHVRKTARAMGISTDASYAFERGSDVEGVLTALRRLVYLAEGSAGAIKDQDGAHVVGLSYVEGPAQEKRKISLSIKEVRRQVNLPRLADVEVTSRLKNLGYAIETSGDAGEIKVTVPSWRLWDVKNHDDLVEDVARSLSLSRVKQELPPLDSETAEATALEQLLKKIEPVLLGQGFYEVMTRSYYSAEAVKALGSLAGKKLARHIEMKNSLESSYSHLKVTNAVHLAQLADMNHRRGTLGTKSYEVGRIFSPEFSAKDGYPFEKDVLTLAAAGRWYEGEWRKLESIEARLQLFRGVLEGIVRAIGQVPSVSESEHPFLHPGMQGALKAGRLIVGNYGVISPALKAELGLKHDVIYAELEVALLTKLSTERQGEMPSDFPSVKRDITLKIPLREQAGRVIRFIEDTKQAHLRSVLVSDDFRKEGEDYRRATLRLVFQAAERTLEHTEVDQAMAAVLAVLKEKHGLEMAS